MDRIVKRVRDLIEKIISIIPIFILVVASGAIIVVISQFGITFDQLIELLKILIWPTIVLLLLLFFRKVFTYLFFSMEEFGFFGAKGKLKNVRAIITEKADDLYQLKLQQEIQNKERTSYQKELGALRTSTIEKDAKYDELLSIVDRVIADKEVLINENDSLKKRIELLTEPDSDISVHDLQLMINDLLAQVYALQNQNAEKDQQ